jgi:zona occludens toxin (predicted ATPase)
VNRGGQVCANCHHYKINHRAKKNGPHKCAKKCDVTLSECPTHYSAGHKAELKKDRMMFKSNKIEYVIVVVLIFILFYFYYFLHIYTYP